MIEIKNINKTYFINQQSFQALNNINLTIQSGQIFGILGKSGAGKSTLLRCVNLLEKPDSGKILIKNIDLNSLSKNALRQQRQKIGMIFQHFNLLESRNVFDNIALALEIAGKSTAEIKARVLELLAIVELSEKKNYFPAQLSGGQKQRVAVARALANHPDVLLSDEATSSLDTESTESILNLLKKINDQLGLTILLITHELNVVKKICDRAGILDNGKLIEQASTMDIFINPQSMITRQLVQQALHFPAIEKDVNAPFVLVQLTFMGKDSDEPVISLISKKFDIVVNILQAQIEMIQNTKVGFTLCKLTGKTSDILQAIAYINSTSIKAAVLDHV